MDASTIRDLRFADPFRPFLMRLRGGRSLLVDAARRLLISPDRRMIVFVPDQAMFEAIRPDMVESVEFVADANSPVEHDHK